VGKRKLDSHGLGQEPVADFCENDNESLDFIKGSEILD
jgi:hypothetical protein